MSENLDRLKKWLDASSYEGIILGRRDNFKWITGENENAVVTNEEVGIGYLLLKKDGSLELLADSSDCPRMSKEQNALNARPILVPWYETSLPRSIISYRGYPSVRSFLELQPKNSIFVLINTSPGTRQ